MFHVKVHFSSIKTLAVIDEPVQLHLKKNEWHYAISSVFQLKEMTHLDINTKFDIDELYPNFLINILVVRQDRPSKILGQIEIDIKEWPIGNEKRKKIILKNCIQVELSIFSEYVSLQGESDVSDSGICLSIEELEQQISQQQQQNNHLSEVKKQLTMKRDQWRVKVDRMGELIGSKIIEKKQSQKQMKKKKQEIEESTDCLAKELNGINEMLVSIINVVNQRGEAEICDKVLDFLMSDQSSCELILNFHFVIFNGQSSMLRLGKNQSQDIAADVKIGKGEKIIQKEEGEFLRGSFAICSCTEREEGCKRKIKAR